MSEQHPPAGWYPHPSMAGTQRYWDGERWTDDIAPMSAAAHPPSTQGGPGVLRIAAGVVLGIAVLIVGIWFLVAVVTTDDDLDCVTDNAQRSQNGQPPRDCD